jgi:amino acid adenylation domain-containing protein/non-ribosomal peptide synthase protein (TIGR01720 family)
VRIDPETTRALVEEANACFNTTTHDLVLAACALAAARSGDGPAVTIDVEHHGRTLFEDAFDLSRTVGWFTSIYPFHVAVDRTTAVDAAIVAVKEKGRALRGHADAFLALRHSAHPAARDAFAGYRDQDLLLNFVGNLDTSELASAWRVAENAAPDHGPANRRTHPIDLMIAIRGGELVARLAYSEASLSKERAQAFGRELASAVRAIVEHCADARNHRKTKSDFPLLDLDDAELARLQGDDVEDAYPLTAMQRAMWFFTELYPSSPLYHVHCVAVLRADLDVPIFERALNLVAEQVPILRTEFARGFKEPVQIVHRKVGYRIDFEDVSGQPPEAQVARRKAFLDACAASDVVGAFPNMRVKILKKGDDLYELVQFFHHAFIDGWSNAGVLGQILETYVTLRETGSARVPALVSHFRDYVAFERAEEASGVSAAFWAERMRGAAINELPLDRPRSASRQFATEMLYFRMDPDLAARVRKMARDEGSTLSEVLAAAHVALVALLTGDSDVTIGYSLAARPGHIPQIQQLAGNFLNTVPLRVPVDTSASLRALVAQARESLRATREHEAYPLASIVRAAGIAGAANGSPFRTMFTAENYPPAKFPAGIQGVDGYNWHMTEYDLAIVLTEMKVRDDAHDFKDEVLLKLAFASDVLTRPTVESWFTLFEAIVRATCTHPESSLGSVLAARLPAPAADAERPLFGQLLEGAFRRFATRKAIVAEGRAVTYAQLEEQVERFAGAFAAAGIGAGDRVLIACQERGAFSTAAVAASLALGVPCVPADGSLPPCRHRALAQSAGVTAVITDQGSRLADALGEDAERLRAILVPRPLEHREDQPPARFVDVASAPRERAPRPSRGAVAYVIHTSGTTGAPKGIAITQDALASFLAWYEHETEIGADDRVSQRLPMGFDASLSEILPTLARGGEVRIDRGLEASTPDDVLAETAAEGTTVLTLPAPYFEEIGDHLRSDAPPLPALRLVVVGGDRLPSEAVRAWRARYPRVTVMNAYGLTEATIASSAFKVDGPERDDGAGSVPIGRTGGALLVLDARLEACAPGAVGEIWITGTAVTVTPHSGRVFTTEGGVRALRTGDLGRVRDDGAIEHVGRRDAQVKLRGQRVDLHGVERALASIDGVARAVAQLETSPDGSRLLVAYVQPRAGASLTLARAALAALLPAHAVPHVILHVPQIPFDASGKVDRAALTRVFAEDAARIPARDPAEDDVTHGLRAIWGRLVGAASAPRHVTFFEVGGDSLAAMRLVEEVRADLGVSLPLEAVLADGTLDDLSACVRRARARHTEDADAR